MPYKLKKSLAKLVTTPRVDAKSVCGAVKKSFYQLAELPIQEIASHAVQAAAVTSASATKILTRKAEDTKNKILSIGDAELAVTHFKTAICGCNVERIKELLNERPDLLLHKVPGENLEKSFLEFVVHYQIPFQKSFDEIFKNNLPALTFCFIESLKKRENNSSALNNINFILEYSPWVLSQPYPNPENKQDSVFNYAVDLFKKNDDDLDLLERVLQSYKKIEEPKAFEKFVNNFYVNSDQSYSNVRKVLGEIDPDLWGRCEKAFLEEALRKKQEKELAQAFRIGEKQKPVEQTKENKDEQECSSDLSSNAREKEKLQSKSLKNSNQRRPHDKQKGKGKNQLRGWYSSSDSLPSSEDEVILPIIFIPPEPEAKPVDVGVIFRENEVPLTSVKKSLTAENVKILPSEAEALPQEQPLSASILLQMTHFLTGGFVLFFAAAVIAYLAFLAGAGLATACVVGGVGVATLGMFRLRKIKPSLQPSASTIEPTTITSPVL
jgi:hypothetical protein